MILRWQRCSFSRLFPANIWCLRIVVLMTATGYLCSKFPLSLPLLQMHLVISADYMSWCLKIDLINIDTLSTVSEIVFVVHVNIKMYKVTLSKSQLITVSVFSACNTWERSNMYLLIDNSSCQRDKGSYILFRPLKIMIFTICPGCYI